MDFSNADNLSNDTFGLRATGKVPLNDDWTFNYEAEFATQSEAGDSTLDYDEEYYRIVPGISGKGFGVKLGYEVLGGDGTAAFRTPLATLHKFNGWADVFLNTPANGLEDVFAEASYKISGTDTVFDGVKLKAVYHDFSGEEGGDFGSEYDLLVGKTFKLPGNPSPFKNVNVLLKYADYNADDTPFVDKEVFWLQLGLKF